MVTSYKWAYGRAVLPTGQSWFNDALNVPRSGIENTRGIWKGQFPWLYNIRMRINTQQSMVKIINYVYMTIIMHYSCVKIPLKNGWITDNDDSNSDSEDDCTADDGLHVVIYPENKNSN
jgi:hypothetical protein